MKTVQKILACFLILLSAALVSPKLTLAQGASGCQVTDPTSGACLDTPSNCDPTSGACPVTSQNYDAAANTDFTMMNLAGHWADCVGEGVDTYMGRPCLDVIPPSDNGSSTIRPKQLGLYSKLPNGGLMGGLSSTMVALYANPPTSATQYLASVGEGFGVVQPAYAQSISGGGAGVIQPILKVWQYMRDIAYLAFIILFLAVGFMIMFRKKINPQTVISVQSALPGLVIGLVLVTFSYFISALLIDASFLGMHLVSGVFLNLAQQGAQNIVYNSQPTVDKIDAAKQLGDLATNRNIWQLFGTFVFNGNHFSVLVGPIKDAFNSILPGGIFNNGLNLKSAGQAVAGGAGFTALNLALVKLPGINSSVAGFLGGGLLGLVAMLVVMIALLIAMFKTLWELIKAYLTIIVTTVISPLVILSASLPGRGEALSGWWKTILVNSLIFPTILAAFLFAGLFLANTNTADFQTTLPLFQGLPIGLFKSILGYGIMLAIPGIPKMVKEAFKVKDNPLGDIAQAGFAGGFAPLKAGYTQGISGFKHQAEEYYNRRTQIRAGTAPVGAPGPTYQRWYRLFKPLARH